jgi:hypothetical protein
MAYPTEKATAVPEFSSCVFLCRVTSKERTEQ